MSTSKHPILRLEHSGPNVKLSDWADLFKPGIIEDHANARSFKFFDEPRKIEGSTYLGLWEAEPHTEVITDFNCDEFMVLLEGQVTIIDDTGHEEVFKPGDCIFMPMGFTGKWQQDSFVRKYYICVEHDVN